MDARLFLKDSKKKYDVIFTDTFSNALSLPFHLLTLEHLNAIKNHLSKKGLAVFNIVGDATFGDLYSKRVDNTLRLVFGNCLAHSIEYDPDKRTNIVYLCNHNHTASDQVIYSDNKNTSGIDFFE